MSQLFETIRVVDGHLFNLEYHTARMNRSRHELFGCVDDIDLNDVIRVPRDLRNGMYKCRVVYARGVEHVEFVPYQRRDIRSLTLVDGDSIEYAYKFVDRSVIDSLVKEVTTDDILIVKHGWITDASFANVVFHDGGRWVTPSTPLLPGTARTRLLENRIIVAGEIKRSDLRHFKKAALINSMRDLDNLHTIAIENILGL